MGILAILAVNKEGQVGNAALSPIGSSMPGKAGFASELHSKLQSDIDLSLFPNLSKPEGGRAESPAATDQTQGQQAASSPAVTLAATAAGVPQTVRTDSVAGNPRVLNPELGAGNSDNAKGLASSIVLDSAKYSPQSADEESMETADHPGKASDGKRALVQVVSQGEAGTQTVSPLAKVTDEKPAAAQAVLQAEPGNQTADSLAETTEGRRVPLQAGLQNEPGAQITRPRIETTGQRDTPVQAGLQNDGVTNSHLNPRALEAKTERASDALVDGDVPQNKGARASLANKSVTVEAGTSRQASPSAQTFAAHQDAIAIAAGSTQFSLRTVPLDQDSAGSTLTHPATRAAVSPSTGESRNKSSKPPLNSKAVAGEAGSTFEASSMAQASPTRQVRPAHDAASSPASDPMDALGRGLPESIPLESATAGSVLTLTGVSQDKSSGTSSSRSVAPVPAGSILQPSSPIQAFGSGLVRSASVSESTPARELTDASGRDLSRSIPPEQATVSSISPKSEPINNPTQTDPGGWAKGLQYAEAEALTHKQSVTTESQPKDPSVNRGSRAGQQARGGQESESSAQAAIGLSRQISPQVGTSGKEGSAFVGGSDSTLARPDTLPATSRSNLNKEFQSAAVASNAKSDNSQDRANGTQTLPVNNGAQTGGNSRAQPPRSAQGAMAGQDGTAVTTRPAQVGDPIDRTGPSGMGKRSDSADEETPSHHGTQLDQQESPGIPEADPRQPFAQQALSNAPAAGALQAKAGQGPSSGPETGLRPLASQQGLSSAPGTRAQARAENSPETSSKNHAETDAPADALSDPPKTPPFWPDFSTAPPFELTKAESTGRAHGPQTGNPNPSSQGGTNDVAGDNSNPALDGTPPSLAQYPTQIQGVGDGAGDRDTGQPDNSTDKKGGEDAQDLTKVADGKGDLPKANAGPALAPQPVPAGHGEASRVSPQGEGSPPVRAESGSANALSGYQANAESVVRSARLTQQAGNAEMQVRLRSEALGPIDVHTVVKGSEIGASIRVEAHDTQVMMASELSQLERALNERSLRVDHLDVLQGSVSGDGSNGSGRDGSQGRPSEPRQSFSSPSAGRTYSSSPETPSLSEDWGLGLLTTRINLRV